MLIKEKDQGRGSAYDVIIIGAGVSGLMAGLNLQNKGIKTLILEKKNTAGGLCGTIVMDDYEFSMACNDFGSGFRKELEKLGIHYPFLTANTLFYFDHARYAIPAKFSTLFQLLPYAGDLIRFIRGLKNKKYSHLEELLNDTVKSPKCKDTLSMFAYALAMPPKDVRIQSIKEGFSKEFNYGYEKPIFPEGGPQKLIDAIVRKFEEMGGTLKLEEDFVGVENEHGRKKIFSSRGTYLSTHLVSSQAQWNQYPQDLKETVPICIAHLALKSSFRFPEKITTVSYLPKNISSWMNELDQGILPEKFGFHITKADLATEPDHYTVNINFLSPRGWNEWSKEAIEKAMDYIVTQLEILLPGIRPSILYQKLISPKEFKEIHKLSSQNFKYVLKEGFTKPDIYDPEKGIYYIGNSVYPPGEHAGGAILSALNASNQIINSI